MCSLKNIKNGDVLLTIKKNPKTMVIAINIIHNTICLNKKVRLLYTQLQKRSWGNHHALLWFADVITISGLELVYIIWMVLWTVYLGSFFQLSAKYDKHTTILLVPQPDAFKEKLF